MIINNHTSGSIPTLRERIIRLGAYLIMAVGFLLAIALILIALAIFVRYPEASFQKRVGTMLGLIIASLVLALIVLAVGEFMLEIAHFAEEVEELETVLSKRELK